MARSRFQGMGPTLARLIPAAILLAVLTWGMGLLAAPLGALFPGSTEVIYPRAGFPLLIWQHFVLVAVSSSLAAIFGVLLGVFVTRPAGREFLPMAGALVAVGQTFPPVAVLAVAVPLVGFGAKPTVAALFLYGLLPIVRNTIAGLEAVPGEIREAARGMGMTERQTLTRVELPLATTVIMAGLRTSVVINIGTATLGATIGAGGLGAPIIAGLNTENPAWILEGALAAGLFAVVADALLELVELRLGRGPRD